MANGNSQPRPNIFFCILLERVNLKYRKNLFLVESSICSARRNQITSFIEIGISKYTILEHYNVGQMSFQCYFLEEIFSTDFIENYAGYPFEQNQVYTFKLQTYCANTKRAIYSTTRIIIND